AGTWFYQIRMINNLTGVVETQTSGTDSFSVNDYDAENIIFNDIVQDPASAQWGGSDFSFSTTVNTSSSYNLTVGLWYGPSASGPWSQINSTNWTNPPGGFQNFNTTTQFNCDDIGSNYYFFNASDGHGTTNLTTPTMFNVTKDYIYLDYTLGDGEDANRSGSQSSPLVFYAENANGTTMLTFPIKYTITTNNVTDYSDDNFIINTNSSGYSNFNFDATCTNISSGEPKFLVGEQQWKASLNDSELTCYFQNDSSDYQSRNLFVYGDITLDFTTPDGSEGNYTQEQTINFLGATTDDCGDALEATVVYNANITSVSGLICDNTTLVGANAFTCNYITTTATTTNWYNLTMFANYSYHYDNNTVKTDTPGFFYIEPLRRLEANTITPSSAYYDNLNWNFTVNATSGDTQQMNITLFLKKGSGGFDECSGLATCENITATICDNCQNQVVYDAGTWFYQ
ncbi:MAG: hypothetical protein KAJ39_10620, partial [Gammaproteobacteria bacterium]|nr:hypothetical protein [Gammaproteobacteria bacterium]